jgi:hypothetical protein
MNSSRRAWRISPAAVPEAGSNWGGSQILRVDGPLGVGDGSIVGSAVEVGVEVSSGVGVIPGRGTSAQLARKNKIIVKTIRRKIIYLWVRWEFLNAGVQNFACSAG